MREASAGALLSEQHPPLPGLTFQGLTFRGLGEVLQQQQQQQWTTTSNSSNTTVPGDQRGIQMWSLPQCQGRALDQESHSPTLTHKREKDRKGSDVPFRLEQLPALQSPQYFLCSGLELLLQLLSREPHLSYLPRPPKGHLSPGLSQAVHSLTLP